MYDLVIYQTTTLPSLEEKQGQKGLLELSTVRNRSHGNPIFRKLERFVPDSR